MIENIAAEQLVFFGFSANILSNLTTSLPTGSVLVYEEPDVVSKRDMHRLAESFPMVSRVMPWEYQRADQLDRLLAESADLRQAKGVVPGVEYGVEAAARVAAALGLPGAGVTAGQVFRDKYQLRELAATAGVRNPRYTRVASVAAAEAFFDGVGGPCVLKPTSRQASLGVQIFRERGEIAPGWALSTEIDEGRVVPDRGIPSDLIMEEVVAGREFSVEVLVAAGQVCFANVTAKEVLPGRFPVEMGHVLPAPVPAGLTRRLVEDTARLAAAAGFGAGILHCEWIVAGEEPTLVECAARMPGDEIPKLITLAYGFPLVEAYVRTLLGHTPETPATAPHAIAIRFLTAPPGVVTAVDGVAAAEQVLGVETIKVTAAAGAVLRNARSSWDRAGYVITRAATAEDALLAATRAEAAIAVTTQPAGQDDWP